MLIALNKDGERVNAKNVPYSDQTTKGDYICPRKSCQQPVFPKKGDKKIDHFAHYPDARECQSWEPESERHIQMKEEMKKLFASCSWADSVELEYTLESDARPDLLVTTNLGFKLAIECQHSKIMDRTIDKRTKKLMKDVDGSVWILDDKIFDDRKYCWYYDEELTFANGKRKIDEDEGYYPQKYTITDSERKIGWPECYFVFNEKQVEVLNLGRKEIACFHKPNFRDKKEDYLWVKRLVEGIVERYATSSMYKLVDSIANEMDSNVLKSYYIRPLIRNLSRCSCDNFIVDEYGGPCRACLGDYEQCNVCGEYKENSKMKKGICAKCRYEWARNKNN